MCRAIRQVGLVGNNLVIPGPQDWIFGRAGQPKARSYATYKIENKEPQPMNRTSLVILLAASMAATVGCSSKNYVKSQTTPLINKTNELDGLTAKNSKDIKDVDARVQSGLAAVNAKTADVEQ